ncbi:unnamed protein product [Echinostoma caproni]|uniref:Transmembrane protein n=1 Tax=Echinostoma caproni TaxID=27848 RepID=A0A183AG20_9TREM|nr:unnamed protein product [Echinostoma caproni]
MPVRNHFVSKGCFGRVDSLLAYMPPKELQELFIVFITAQVASIIVFIIYRCMKRQQLMMYLKKSDLENHYMPSAALTLRPRRGDIP